jgi:hypothetical protein
MANKLIPKNDKINNITSITMSIFLLLNISGILDGGGCKKPLLTGDGFSISIFLLYNLIKIRSDIIYYLAP